MRPFGSPQQLEHRRKRAIEMLGQGRAPAEVARALGVERRSVRRWRAAYDLDGEKGVRAAQASGRPAKLDSGQRKRLERLLAKGARSAGFATDLWTCPRVAQAIRSRFGVSFHVDHIGRLLHGMGWSPQRPQRQALERDPSFVARWVKATWPAVKKKPRD